MSFWDTPGLITPNVDDDDKWVINRVPEAWDRLTGELRLPNRYVKVGERAFMGCDKLETVWLSSKTYILKQQAFAGCINLRTVVVPASGFLAVGERAFAGCTKLKQVDLRNCRGRLKIDPTAFEGCPAGLKVLVPFRQSIPLPASVAAYYRFRARYGRNFGNIDVPVQHRGSIEPFIRTAFGIEGRQIKLLIGNVTIRRTLADVLEVAREGGELFRVQTKNPLHNKENKFWYRSAFVDLCL